VRVEIVRFTDTEHYKFPIVDTSRTTERDCVLMNDRAKSFADAILAGKEPFPMDLEIPVDDANACLYRRSDYLRDNAYLEIGDENTISLGFSLPVDKLPGGKGRYFSGVATIGSLGFEDVDVDFKTALFFDLSTRKHQQTDGEIDSDPLVSMIVKVLYNNVAKKWTAYLTDGEFLGWTVPDDDIDKNEDLLAVDHDNRDLVAVLNGIQGITLVPPTAGDVGVDSGRIIVHARRRRPDEKNDDDDRIDANVRLRRGSRDHSGRRRVARNLLTRILPSI